MTSQKLPCPHCGGYRSKVMDSRPSVSGGFFRRRECLACGTRFNTEEVVSRYATARTKQQTQHKM